MQVKIRQALAEDKNFVLSTWLRNYRHSSAFARGIRTSVYFEWHHRLLVNLMARPECTVLIACDEEEPNLILGYIAFEQGIVHYVYVKRSMRGFGLGKKLLEEAMGDRDFECSHVTDAGHLWMRNNPRCQYNPYRV